MLMVKARDFPDVSTKAAGLSQRADQAARKARLTPPPPPAHADSSSWSDPDDTVNTREPKQVRGHRRGDVLGRLHRRGKDITRDHLEAATLFRCDWDVAMHGLTGQDPLLTGPGGTSGPSLGPKARDVARLRAQSEVQRVRAAIGLGAWPLLYWVVCENRDVASWVEAHDWAQLDPKKELGKLTAVLTRLAEHYGVDSRRDELKRIRRELSQR